MTPPKVGALRMLPASKHRARGGQAPYILGLPQLPKPWAGNHPHSKSRNSHRLGQGGGGLHPCVWALAAFGTPSRGGVLGQVAEAAPCRRSCLPPHLCLSQPQ